MLFHELLLKRWVEKIVEFVSFVESAENISNPTAELLQKETKFTRPDIPQCIAPIPPLNNVYSSILLRRFA